MIARASSRGAAATASRLFAPLTIRGLTVRNRVWLSPMCQYSVEAMDGVPSDWHLVHLGARAAGGFGLVMAEATAVDPVGRISPQDTGLWSDIQAVAWRRIAEFVHSQGAAIGIQLAHAGRKASTYALHAPHRGAVPMEEGGWQTWGPTTTPLPGLPAPHAMTLDDIGTVVEAFGDAAERAHWAGFDVVELHAAHGYLIHQFLSPLSNHRTDAYGGDFEARSLFATEVVKSVRRRWPAHKPLFMRLSGTEWVDGGWDTADCARLAALVEPLGVDLIDASSGGVGPAGGIAVGPGYQVPFAKEIRERAGIPTAAVGLIVEATQADEVLASGAADAVFIGRAALRDASWPLRAGHELGLDRDTLPYPPQYLRGAWRHPRAATI
ncbi:NADH:flavin oxidoreductase/NADH oxidase [Pseudarthrobacter sp. NPDC055928]|uniref:NADH:flavin oxidoreductase/NADH oxidase n=1 Tax=Pseudarthrobacter sp. NPDC055928 TaxID=3345661 RepID=UPI0035E22A9D